jgi:hypothetical protein
VTEERGRAGLRQYNGNRHCYAILNRERGMPRL